MIKHSYCIKREYWQLYEKIRQLRMLIFDWLHEQKLWYLMWPTHELVVTRQVSNRLMPLNYDNFLHYYFMDFISERDWIFINISFTRIQYAYLMGYILLYSLSFATFCSSNFMPKQTQAGGNCFANKHILLYYGGVYRLIYSLRVIVNGTQIQMNIFIAGIVCFYTLSSRVIWS